MIETRQNEVVEGPDGEQEDVFFSPVAAAIKFGILLGLIVLVSAYFCGGYWHAKKRMKKGKKLLRYHRWMIPQRRPMQNPQAFYRPPPQFNSSVDPNSYYGNFNAPPAYNAERPPMYQPGKEQDIEMTAQPPAGPPPGREESPAEPLPARPNANRFDRFRFWQR